MLSLAPIRYSKVYKENGGPIERLEYSREEIFGRSCVQATAYLSEDFIPNVVRVESALALPDGAGTHASAQIACHMAISEVIERWAVLSCRSDENDLRGGADIDASSNGFAAFPGFYRRQARNGALCESIERHCLICWWEGLLNHQSLPDPASGVHAIQVENPYSSHAVVILWTCDDGRYAYSFGASNGLNSAVWRSLVELHRTCQLVRGITELSSGREGELPQGHIYEQRIRHFSGGAGVDQFLDRLEAVSNSYGKSGAFELLYDAAVMGPWDRYAGVWRTIIKPPSRRYLSDAVDYFFW